MTTDQRLAMMREPMYQPELDLVTTAPDGSIAAFCVCSVDGAANERLDRSEGEIGVVGTRPEFQRRGLGRAMVLAGMSALRQQGLEIATMGVLSSNRAALRTYRSLGFRTRFSKRWYEKSIDPHDQQEAKQDVNG